MMDLLLDVCPSFRPEWSKFLLEWADTEDKPLYLALGMLARHLIAMLADGDTSGLTRVFAVVERWHVQGDPYVKEAATIGLLEALQNENLHQSTSPVQFEPLLSPQSLTWWTKVEAFWTKRDVMTDD